MLGQAASKRGIFGDDTDGGELEIGQIASAIKAIEPVGTIMQRIIAEFGEAKAKAATISF